MAAQIFWPELVGPMQRDERELQMEAGKESNSAGVLYCQPQVRYSLLSIFKGSKISWQSLLRGIWSLI